MPVLVIKIKERITIKLEGNPATISLLREVAVVLIINILNKILTPKKSSTCSLVVEYSSIQVKEGNNIRDKGMAIDINNNNSKGDQETMKRRCHWEHFSDNLVLSSS
jgi:hypothetical protein